MVHRDGKRADEGAGSAILWLDEGRSPQVLAVIWATIELERALGDLGPTPDAAGATVSAAGAVEDPFLGARVVVVPSHENGIRIALAEPSTEGRLAATLARNGEGPAGRYVLAPFALAVVEARAAAANVVLSKPASGPFGPAVLVLGGPAAGPHLILVDPAAVPSSP
ncbi:MAG TPA: hypothetical protein VHM48_00430 [Candidatus Limnocylindrales bacterium]|nr:hypothetical protein [Candidatus Limnocylindrales bacterium]